MSISSARGPRMCASFAWAVLTAALVGLPSSSGAEEPPRARLAFERVVLDEEGPLDTWLKSVGDLNGDGRPDLIAGGHRDSGLVWYEAPTWRKRTIAAEGSFSTDGEVADVDRDGDNDIVALKSQQIVWLENPSWKSRTIDKSTVHDVEVDDFDGDGRIDLVARNQGAFGAKGDTLHFYRQETDGDWTRRDVKIDDGEGLACADMDRDGDADVVVGGYWLENSGEFATGRWTPRAYSTNWKYPYIFIFTGDLNGDGRLDIVLSPSEKEGGSYRISWFESPPDPKASGWSEHVVEEPVETVHHFIGTGDFDGDGRLDIASARMQQARNPEIALYLNEGRGQQWAKHVVSPTSSHSMRIVDADGDGRPDLFGADWRGSRVIELWRNASASQKASK